MKNIRYRQFLAGLAILLAIGCGLAWAADIHNLSALEARTLIEANRNNAEFVILDVRTPGEYAQGHIAGALLLDYKNPRFSAQLDRLDKSKHYLIYCRTGNRSGRALQMMDKLGFDQIFHLKAGITDWASQKLPLVK